MFIKKIDIINFKGFEERHFEFKSNFTVAIGNNGLGKSSLLNAIQVGLGAYLQSMPQLSGSKYRRQFKPSERYTYFDKLTKSYTTHDANTTIEVNALCNKVDLIWKREFQSGYYTTHNKRDSQQIIDYAENLYKNKESIFPILACFETNRINAQVGRVDKSWKRTSRLQKGYFSALNDTVNFKGVYEWLESYENARKLDNEFEDTREAFYDAIRRAIPYIEEIEYSKSYGEFELIVNFKDNQVSEWKLYSNLSDGMKAVLNIVSEIAYRCIMLNGRLGINAVLESTGVVTIDELDMHLHPNWQKHVVNDFKKAFPNIQFIITTHSPFIVQSLRKNEVINLDSPGLELDPISYGIEDVSEGEMNVEDVPRSIEFQNRAKIATRYFELISQGKKSESDKEVAELRHQLNELEERFSDDPVFVGQLRSERKLYNL